MKLTFSGKTREITPVIQEKFTARLSKLSKLVERRGEREAHVIHQTERHLHKIELVMNVYDHSLVGEGSHSDLETALASAATKLEKQVLKMRNRWRDTHRDPKAVRSSKEEAAWVEPEAPKVKKAALVKAAVTKEVKPARSAKPKIFRVTQVEDRKPMTMEEAMLEMESGVNYCVYHDSDRDCLSVLVRRADGNFDLIES